MATKAFSVNQVFIKICANPVAGIKENTIPETVLNLQFLWRQCRKSTPPVVFSVKGLTGQVIEPMSGGNHGKSEFAHLNQS